MPRGGFFALYGRRMTNRLPPGQSRAEVNTHRALLDKRGHGTTAYRYAKFDHGHRHVLLGLSFATIISRHTIIIGTGHKYVMLTEASGLAMYAPADNDLFFRRRRRADDRKSDGITSRPRGTNYGENGTIKNILLMHRHI